MYRGLEKKQKTVKMGRITLQKFKWETAYAIIETVVLETRQEMYSLLKEIL